MDWSILVGIAENVGLSISVLGIIGVAWELALHILNKIKGSPTP